MPQVDRLPPHSIESEQGTLGCMLLDAAVIDDVRTALKSSDAFFDLRHRTVYEYMCAMRDRGDAIDVIVLHQKLKDAGQLNAVGGLDYIASLPDSVPSARNIDYYVDIVREKYLLRRMVQVCTEVVGRVNEHEGDVDKLLDRVETDLLDLRSDRLAECDWGVKDAVRSVIKEIESYADQGTKQKGIQTGFIDFDKVTGGLMPEQMIVIAGRPSVGKSSWALNVADHVAVNCRIPVGYFSFEMGKESLMKRAIASRSRVNLRWVKDGFTNPETDQKLSKASGSLAGAPLFIDDRPSQNIIQVRSKARRMRLKHNVGLIVIDYLQLMHGQPGKKYRSEPEELSDISGGVKEMARELGIPVIVLSQLNREVEKESKPRKPRMSDLRGSGGLEQDADLIGLLYRASRDNRHAPASDGDSRGDPVIPVNMMLDKNRDGDAGIDIHFTFLKALTKFESAAKISNDDEQSSLPYKDA